MKNMNRILSLVMIITLAAYSLMSGIAANAAVKGVIKPQLKVVGLKSTYKFNSGLKINIATSNYTRKVKYRVSLYNFTTKKSVDLTKGYSKSMGGSKYLPISVLPKAAGKYGIRIYVKALASKANYDNYMEKIFVVEANKTAIVTALKYAEVLAKSKVAGVKIGNVTSGDMAVYQNIINSARTVKNNFFASQAEVNASVMILKAAAVDFKNSVLQSSDKTALVNAIKAAQQRVKAIATGNLPGQVAWGDKIDMIQAITVASQLAVDYNASTEKVNEATVQLSSAIAIFGDKVLKENVSL